jgi:hypothetical protein
MHMPIYEPKAPTMMMMMMMMMMMIIVEVFDSGGEGLGGWSPTVLWRSGFDPRPVYTR